MRTTVDINPDLLERVRKLADDEGISFKDALNRTLTRGLSAAAPAAREPFRMPTFPLGLERYYDINNINKQLADEDTEEFLRKFYPDRVHEP